MRSNQFAADQQSRIPLTVIGGSAASGKTTLVRHLLDYTVGRRLVAVLADDRGLDQARIERRDGPFIFLRNGCGCIVAGDDCASALATLARSPDRPDHVVVEGTGWTDSRRLGGYGYMPGYRPDGTVLVVDAPTVKESTGDSGLEYALQEQLRAADIVVLNKVDLAGEREAAAAQMCLERLAPASRVLWSDHARVAPPLLLGVHDTPDQLESRTTLAAWTDQYKPIRSTSGGTRSAQQVERARCWCLVAEAPVDMRAFREWVHQLPAGILRGNGTVHLREEPRHRHVLHLFGSHWRVERGTPWGRDVPSTRVLLAGIGAGRRAPLRHLPFDNGRSNSSSAVTSHDQ